MKKDFLILSIVALLASFASCDPMDSGDDAQKPGIENPDNNGDDTPTPPAEGEGEGNENEGEGTTPVPPTPTETKTITLDFSEQPFTTDIHVHSSAAKSVTELTTFTLMQEEVSYQFEVNSPERGFCYVSSCLRLICDGTASGSNYGYIKLPGLDGFTLSGINITSGNTTNKKDYYIFDKDPLTATSAEDAVHTFELSNNEPFEVNLYGKTAVGEGCYLAALGKNTQFSKLVLTYTK